MMCSECYETNIHIEFNVAAGPQCLNIFISEILLQRYCKYKSLLNLFLVKGKGFIASHEIPTT